MFSALAGPRGADNPETWASDLKNWVEVFKSLVSNTKVLKIFAFSNNHYAGYGPATAKLFMDLWNKEQ